MQASTQNKPKDIKAYMQRIDQLAEQSVTASVREKLQNAQTLYAEYRAGNTGEEEMRELLENFVRDPELKGLQDFS